MTRALCPLLALAGCFDGYARTARHNAPGNVPDLDVPSEHENGDPARFDAPADPGHTDTWLWAIPYAMGNLTAGSRDTTELGGELRLEHHTSPDATTEGFAHPTPIASVGGALVDVRDHQASVVPGALFAELGGRALIGGVVPFELGVGPVGYLGDHAVGAQVTARLLMLIVVRVRVLDHGASEAMIGVQIPWLFAFGSSR